MERLGRVWTGRIRREMDSRKQELRDLRRYSDRRSLDGLAAAIIVNTAPRYEVERPAYGVKIG